MSKLICLREFSDESKALTAKSFLKTKGVVADVFRAGNSFHGHFDKHRLVVKKEDKERAKNLLKEIT